MVGMGFEVRARLVRQEKRKKATGPERGTDIVICPILSR
jgi:hypothetical protein